MNAPRRPLRSASWAALVTALLLILAVFLRPHRAETPTPEIGGSASSMHHPPDRPDEAAEYLAEQRLPPGADEIPMEDLWKALDEIRAREAALASSDGSPPGDIQGWQALGPGNVGGRTRALVIDPTDPNVMYAAGVSGGIFKSTDAGASWTTTDDAMLNLAVCTMAIDPTNPNVIYAGTGEGFGLLSFVRGLGIFRSIDAGASWAQLPATSRAVAGEAFYYVNKVLLSPNDPDRIYAATKYGVYRSLDGGDSWTAVLANPRFAAAPFVTHGCQLGCVDLAIRSDSDPDVLFAAFGVWERDGLYRSDDGGETWVEYPTPPRQGRMTIAVAPSDNDRIYVALAENPDSLHYGRMLDLWRSDDGVTFHSVLDFGTLFGPELFSVVAYSTGCVEGGVDYSQGWYDQVLAVDPLDRDVLWLGGIDLYRSDDAGVTFGLAGYWFFDDWDPPHPNYIHADHHAIVFQPGYDGAANQTLYVGNDGGLFRTTNARAPTSQEECPIDSLAGPFPGIVWENLNHGYAVTQFYHGDVARDRPMFVGGSQDNGTCRVLAVGAPETWKRILGGDGGYAAIDPTDSDRIFASTEGFPAIWLSTDGGENFDEATNGITDTDGLFITPLVMDPSDPDVLWSGGSRPWRTTNGAALWQLAGPDFPDANRISAIGVAPSDGNVVYLGFENGYIARSTNGLSPSPDWTLQSNGLRLGASVSDITVDPLNPDVAFCTYSNYSGKHIYRTLDGGALWEITDGIRYAGVPNIPVHCLAIRPGNPQQLYAGSELGVFASDDGGGTWNPANTGLPHTVVEALVFPDPDTLVAFTFGRGAFLTSLEPAATSVAEEEGRTARPTLSAAPSPFNPTVTLRADLPRTGAARLTIHDVQGRLVAVLLDGSQAAGSVTRVWDGRNTRGEEVASGTYFARLEAAGTVTSSKLVLAR